MSCLEGWGWPAHYLQAGAGCNGQTDRLKVIVTIKLHLTSRDIEKSTMSLLCACAMPRMLVFVSMARSYCLGPMQTLSLPPELYLLAPDTSWPGQWGPSGPVPAWRRGNTWARSVTLNVSSNSHKEAMSGDKMFYFQPQILASKWQDCRVSLNLTPDL